MNSGSLLLEGCGDVEGKDNEALVSVGIVNIL
jgi:hypothetical protein